MDLHNSAVNYSNRVIKQIKTFLPVQAPLKDFIFQNSLKSFQNLSFHDALNTSSVIFGYKNYLKIEEYRSLVERNEISFHFIDRAIEYYGLSSEKEVWMERLMNKSYPKPLHSRIGFVRDHWKKHYKIDLDSLVYPTLFRVVCSYLDQGIAIWNFPANHKGFLSAIKELEKNSLTSFFKQPRARRLLLEDACDLDALLNVLVGKEEDYEHYLFDQQFAHPGWSGIVSAIEDNPDTLLDNRKIELEEFIRFELLLEIDALDTYFSDVWSPLSHKLPAKHPKLFDQVELGEDFRVLSIFQDAYEWTFYNDVLKGIQNSFQRVEECAEQVHVQTIFCIDDRECSLRRYLELSDKGFETFGTPGHFNLDFYFQPEHSKFYTKVCPAPVTPKVLIKENEKKGKPKKDPHYSSRNTGLIQGWLMTYMLGFWSVFRLVRSIFKPSKTSAFVSSFHHMDPEASLTIEHKNQEKTKEGFQIGFTVLEMADRLEALLKSIGLVSNFASIVYFIGHGSSSSNNPFYTTMDCGACSCKPGSVNARGISWIANDKRVRLLLEERGISIPEETVFIGGLHDTARDEISFFDTTKLTVSQKEMHSENYAVFEKCLEQNARERSRRFQSIDSTKGLQKVHKKVKQRTVSLFEPRPELDHATATLCIVGRRKITKKVFLDRRAFLNSYDYRVDPDGKYLLAILNAATPVCGGINLNYYFSKVDNQNFGSGSKLPHNVMGLIGVSNGIDGDIRPGLPSQMVELHDPMRLLMIVEHFPEVVYETIQKNPDTYEWYTGSWINLVVLHPETGKFFRFEKGKFEPYVFVEKELVMLTALDNLMDNSGRNLPVYLIN